MTTLGIACSVSGGNEKNLESGQEAESQRLSDGLEQSPGIQSLLAFDSIRPIYSPFFLPAEEAPYQDEELVIGVTRGGEAKAYSITVLRVREMVNDELAGLPILVTW